MYRRAFTLMELLVTIAIIAILAAILFPVLGNARQSARQTTCLSNINQLSKAMMMYASDNGGMATNICLWNNWIDQLKPYGVNYLELACPTYAAFMPADGRKEGYDTGYAVNACLYSSNFVSDPSNTVMLTETTMLKAICKDGYAREYPYALSGPDIWNNSKTVFMNCDESQPVGPLGSTRHLGGSNYSMLDGSAKWLKPTQLRLPEHGSGCFATLTSGPIDGPRFQTGGIK